MTGSPDHESQDSTRHSTECREVRETRRKYHRLHYCIEKKFGVDKEIVPALLGPGGPLLGTLEAKGYISASDEYALALLKAGSAAAIQLAYDHALWMHLVGGRFHYPGIYLSAALLLQGEDKLCFKYALVREKDAAQRLAHYPNIASRDALLSGFADQPDILEQLRDSVHGEKYISKESGYAITLILYWWIQDLRNLQKFREVEGWFTDRMNSDTVYLITKAIPDTGFVLKERLYAEDNAQLIEELNVWIRFYFLRVTYQHPAGWQTLVETIENGGIPSWQGGQDVRPEQCCWRAWRDTPGAVEFVNEMIPKAKKWVEGTRYSVARALDNSVARGILEEQTLFNFLFYAANIRLI
ncbi:hypothetical protein TWF730_006708 [Orbilia blumenaviensis]|uniref:Uncharacterized protein n=1 Tax=Orbilia blumenaviensis TaxID=1796055 RepID=A0AAV9VHM3_9PEZI